MCKNIRSNFSNARFLNRKNLIEQLIFIYLLSKLIRLFKINYNNLINIMRKRLSQEKTTHVFSFLFRPLMSKLSCRKIKKIVLLLKNLLKN